MIPLPAALGGRSPLIAWRLDNKRHEETWDSGEGAYLYGGRWNSRGVRAVYCSLDPSTTILEVAVHNGFDALDTIPHILTEIEISDPQQVHVVAPDAVPNPNWLTPSIPGAGQQAFGDDLLRRHAFIVIPSAVSRRSWNLIFVRSRAEGAYSAKSQDRFALDPRLNPAERR